MFRCEGKFGPGHVCKNKTLNLLLVAEEEIEELKGAELLDDQSQPENIADGPESAVLCLSSLVGFCPPNAMKVKGRIKKQEVVVLIDSGASHNFISEKFLTESGLTRTPTHEFSVQMGNGDEVKNMGVCKGVHLQLDGLDVVADFYPLVLGSTDVILGFKWLASLGDAMMNWGKLSLQVTLGGCKVKLQGDPSLCHSQVSLHSMRRTIQHEGQGLYLELHQLHMTEHKQAEQCSDHNTNPAVSDLLSEFESIFHMPDTLPPNRSKQHSIVLKEGTSPISVRPYRYPQIQKDEIERLVKEMLAAGIIQPSSSPYSSPILLVKKKDGSWRFCVDYRALNLATIPDKFPIPMVEELLDELHGATIFSKIDLKSRYHQIRMSEDDVPKTAFRTHNGHYEFLVMPFGLTNAPSTFQSLMNDVFRAYLRRFVLIFFDDILVFSKSEEAHLQHLRQVFQVLQEQELYANRKKCIFAKPQIEYLGHIIDASGVSVDPTKIQAMVDWPVSTSLRLLRGFLGLTGYYRRFVANYSKLAWPLTQQLKKDAFCWNVEADLAFKNLKDAMCSVPVLALPDFNKTFVVETDASGVGLGAVLMQENRPIAYFSHKLSPLAQSKSVYERELMGIVFAIKKWRPYLLGRKFIVRTDQNSLKHLLEQRIVEGEFQKWLLKLMGYNFEIQYRPGAENKAADALSRVPENMTVKALTLPFVQDWDEINALVEEDPFLANIKKVIVQDPTAYPKFTLVGNSLLYKNRRAIPADSPIIPLLLKEFHTTAIGGHGGVRRTYQRIYPEFYWKGLKKSIQDFVRSCEVCQRQKYDTTLPAGLLQPLPVPQQVWEAVTMDFIEGLPKSKGFDAIMVVVDRLSKYAHFIALSHPFSAPQIAQKFMEGVIRLHGVPRSLVSDRDRIFMSSFWTELFKLMGSELRRSSAYHPQTDGQSEVVNRCLETYLRCFSGDKPSRWSSWLA